jgi:nitrogen fixation protein FixH
MTPSSARPANSGAGRWIPWVFVGAFGLIIAVNAALIWFAVGSFSGLAEAHPYQAGLDYNRTLAAARAQEALGWRAELSLAPAAEPGAMLVSASLVDGRGHAIEGATVEAEFARPAARGHDRAAVLAPQAGGAYAAIVPLGLKGQWEVRLVAQSGGVRWQTTQRVIAP